ncbi:hypothetical protein [Rhizobium rhizogenes]|uniref:hypothetical protein n=1 Tax=Rhizobium rhizogenes TaxID=359 RepID=UPI0015746A80|nr:hypothetical protein [Rhizobium rhizogenes]NTG94250.1 hypothetical protein [Rhizobium rhizogenes]
MDPTRPMNENLQAGQQVPNHVKADGMVRPAGSVAWVASGRGPRIMFAPPDVAGLAGAAGTGSGDGAAAGAADGGDNGAGTGASSDGAGAGSDGAGSSGEQKPQRPDWLPESLWDGEKGFKQQDFDDLVAFKAERISAEASRPESADAYEVALPQDFKLPENIKLEEGQSIVDPADPRVVELRKIAHAKGWSQSDFQDVLALGVNMDIATQERQAEALKAESAKLGSRSKERIEAVTSWVDAKLGPKLGNALKHMLYTAEQVEAFERLMSVNRGDVPGTPGAGRDVGKKEISDEEWDKMSPSARINYARQASKK